MDDLPVIVPATMQQCGLGNQSAESNSCGGQLDSHCVWRFRLDRTLQEKGMFPSVEQCDLKCHHRSHSHAYRKSGHKERTKNKDTTLCQHQEDSGCQCCVSDVL